MAKSGNDSFDDLGGIFSFGADANSSGNIPTGHFALDFAIHHGVNPEKVDLSQVEGYDPSSALGLPLGRVVEIFGEEGSGKSSLAYRVCGYAQKMGNTCIWIDAENSFSTNLADINGVDRTTLLYSDLSNKRNADKVLYAEDVLDAIIFACKKKGEGAAYYKNLAVVVVDSVANLTPKARMEASSEQLTPGAMARVMSENLKKVVNYASKHQVLIIFINQLREKIGVMFGNPETTPGGKALKFAASVRLKVSKQSKGEIYRLTEDGNNELIGGKAWVRIEKNRFAKPFKDPEKRDRIEVPIYYELYFPNLDDMLFDVAKQLKIIRPYKDEFRWKDAQLAAEGREGFIQTVKFKGLYNQLVLQVKETAETEGVILPPELATKVIDLEPELEKLKQSSTTTDEAKAEEKTADDNDKQGPTRRKRKGETG